MSRREYVDVPNHPFRQDDKFGEKDGSPKLTKNDKKRRRGRKIQCNRVQEDELGETGATNLGTVDEKGHQKTWPKSGRVINGLDDNKRCLLVVS